MSSQDTSSPSRHERAKHLLTEAEQLKKGGKFVSPGLMDRIKKLRYWTSPTAQENEVQLKQLDLAGAEAEIAELGGSPLPRVLNDEEERRAENARLHAEVVRTEEEQARTRDEELRREDESYVPSFWKRTQPSSASTTTPSPSSDDWLNPPWLKKTQLIALLFVVATIVFALALLLWH